MMNVHDAIKNMPAWAQEYKWAINVAAYGFKMIKTLGPYVAKDLSQRDTENFRNKHRALGTALKRNEWREFVFALNDVDKTFFIELDGAIRTWQEEKDVTAREQAERRRVQDDQHEEVLRKQRQEDEETPCLTCTRLCSSFFSIGGVCDHEEKGFVCKFAHDLASFKPRSCFNGSNCWHKDGKCPYIHPNETKEALVKRLAPVRQVPEKRAVQQETLAPPEPDTDTMASEPEVVQKGKLHVGADQINALSEELETACTRRLQLLGQLDNIATTARVRELESALKTRTSELAELALKHAALEKKYKQLEVLHGQELDMIARLIGVDKEE